MELSSDSNVQTKSFASIILSKNTVDTSKDYILSDGHQLINFDETIIDGTLILDGSLVIIG
jgi:hypothetical protein